MLTIRLNRVGRHNRAYYRVVVQEHAAAPGGRHVAVVGSYDPYKKQVTLKEDEIKHWLSVGAQPSDTVHNLLVKRQIIVGQKKRPKGKIVESKAQEKNAKEDDAAGNNEETSKKDVVEEKKENTSSKKEIVEEVKEEKVEEEVKEVKEEKVEEEEVKESKESEKKEIEKKKED